MKTMLFKFLLARLLLFSTMTMLHAEEVVVLPRQFSGYIGSFMGDAYRFALHDGVVTLTFCNQSRTNKTLFTPTPKQWQEFRQTLDSVKV
jgi:hypothetical protein